MLWEFPSDEYNRYFIMEQNGPNNRRQKRAERKPSGIVMN